MGNRIDEILSKPPAEVQRILTEMAAKSYPTHGVFYEVLAHIIGPQSGGHALRIGTTLVDDHGKLADIPGFRDAVHQAQQARIHQEESVFGTKSEKVYRHVSPSDVHAGVDAALANTVTRNATLDTIFAQFETDVKKKGDAFGDRYDDPSARKTIRDQVEAGWRDYDGRIAQFAGKGPAG